MCVLLCCVWSPKKASLGCDKLCWWPLNFSTLHNYTCIRIDEFILPKSGEISQNVKFHPSKPGHGRGSAPYGQSDSTSRPWAGPSWTVEKQRASRKSLSWTWLDSWRLTLVALSLEHLWSCARNFAGTSSLAACSRYYPNSDLDTD